MNFKNTFAKGFNIEMQKTIVNFFYSFSSHWTKKYYHKKDKRIFEQIKRTYQKKMVRTVNFENSNPKKLLINIRNKSNNRNIKQNGILSTTHPTKHFYHIGNSKQKIIKIQQKETFRKKPDY
jgi:hypothetical protein